MQRVPASYSIHTCRLFHQFYSKAPMDAWIGSNDRYRAYMAHSLASIAFLLCNSHCNFDCVTCNFLVRNRITNVASAWVVDGQLFFFSRSVIRTTRPDSSTCATFNVGVTCHVKLVSRTMHSWLYTKAIPLITHRAQRTWPRSFSQQKRMSLSFRTAKLWIA